MVQQLTEDEEYKKIRKGIFFSSIGAEVWMGLSGIGFLAAFGVLAIAGTAILPIVGAIVLGAASLACAYKGWQATIDSQAGIEEINAYRTARHLHSLQQGRQLSVSQSVAPAEEYNPKRRDNKSWSEVNPPAPERTSYAATINR